MSTLKKLALLPALAALATGVALRAEEKKIKRSDLPPAVEKTVAEQSKGATIKGFATEVEDGKKLYEAEMIVNGHGKDISIDEKGNVIEIEEEVAIGSLPPTVK